MSHKDAMAVVMAQADAMKRGALTMWTIYDRPSDHPHGFIARRFEIDVGKITATEHKLISDLEGLRKIFHAAGLMKLSRQEEDEPQIVETWV